MLKEKNIVVTGALQGIGRQAVIQLPSFGANIWACAHIIDDEFLQFCDDTAKANSVNIYPLEADYNSIDSVKSMGREILKSKLPIDGLVNVAGITKDAIFQMTSSSDLGKIYDVNVVATLVLTQAVCKNMQRNGSGSIVNISSISAMDGVEGQLSYSSSKAALLGSTRTLARELGPNGIRVNCIAPGVIDTQMNADVPTDILEDRVSGTSLKRMGDPKEVVDLIAFLLSDLSTYVTGQIVRVDGGMA
jgi:3-oxoacyl-[acyl-carrier protein] reductase